MTAALVVSLAIQTQTKVTLQLFQDEFVVRQGSTKIEVPLHLDKPKPVLSVVFRKGDHFAVWDDRGLSIRAGKRVQVSKLKEIAVSPKVFEREEIRTNLELMKEGKRSREASALSGAKRIGNDAFFLARWDDTAGRPWLEALVTVSLTDPKPQWKLLGRFEGISLARQPIDDKLRLHNGALAVITTRGSEWGESFYTADQKAFGFRKLGNRLVDFSTDVSPATAPPPSITKHAPADGESLAGKKSSSAVFVEKSAYGTYVAGRIDLDSAQRAEFLETKQAVRMLDDIDAPRVAVLGEGVSLRNVSSGAEMRLPNSSAARRAGNLIVVWTPATKPAKAWIYDPDRWQQLANWLAK